MVVIKHGVVNVTCQSPERVLHRASTIRRAGADVAIWRARKRVRREGGADDSQRVFVQCGVHGVRYRVWVGVAWAKPSVDAMH